MAMNFSFVIPNKLAGMEYPGSWATLEEDLQFLQAQGVTGMVTLTENELDLEALTRHNMQWMHLPIRDFTPPTMEQIQSFIQFVDTNDGAVVVHCRAGMGRTGTMLACYFVATGMDAEDAIDRVRALRPHSIETREQEQTVVEFARRRPGNGRR